MDSSSFDQYQLLSFVLYGNYPGTYHDGGLSGSVLSNEKRLEASDKGTFVLPSFDHFRRGIHFDRLTGGWR